MGLHKLTQALLLVLAPLCVQAADTAKPVVNLYIWGEYLAPDTLTNFEEENRHPCGGRPLRLPGNRRDQTAHRPQRL